jgi:hypothetical protein
VQHSKLCGSTSGLGHQRKSPRACDTSALGPIADMSNGQARPQRNSAKPTVMRPAITAAKATKKVHLT